jgi:hypothetical protein
MRKGFGKKNKEKKNIKCSIVTQLRFQFVVACLGRKQVVDALEGKRVLSHTKRTLI